MYASSLTKFLVIAKNFDVPEWDKLAPYLAFIASTPDPITVAREWVARSATEGTDDGEVFNDEEEGAVVKRLGDYSEYVLYLFTICMVNHLMVALVTLHHLQHLICSFIINHPLQPHPLTTSMLLVRLGNLWAQVHLPDDLLWRLPNPLLLPHCYCLSYSFSPSTSCYPSYIQSFGCD